MWAFSALSTALLCRLNFFLARLHLYTYSCELVERLIRAESYIGRRMEKMLLVWVDACVCVYSMWLFVRLQSFQFRRCLPLISITNAVGSHTFFLLPLPYIYKQPWLCVLYFCVCLCQMNKKKMPLLIVHLSRKISGKYLIMISIICASRSRSEPSWKLDDSSSSLHSTDFCQLDVYINGTPSIFGWWLRYIDGIRDSRWRPAVLTQGQL